MERRRADGKEVAPRSRLGRRGRGRRGDPDGGRTRVPRPGVGLPCSGDVRGLAGGAGATLVAGTGKLAEQLSTQAPLTIEQARGIIAQLSVVNPEVAQALSLAAQALTGASSPAISPFDQTAVQLAGVLSSLA